MLFRSNAFAVVSHTFKNFTSSLVVPMLPSVPVNHYLNHRGQQSVRPKSSSVFYASLSERVLTTARFEHSNFVKVTVACGEAPSLLNRNINANTRLKALTRHNKVRLSSMRRQWGVYLFPDRHFRPGYQKLHLQPEIQLRAF